MTTPDAVHDYRRTNAAVVLRSAEIQRLRDIDEELAGKGPKAIKKKG